VRIVSRDKDLHQLLTDRVKLWDPMKDEIIDAASLEKLAGYTPQQAVEIQTLMGDAIDNVPGIPGVGPKTAISLIKKYGTAEGVVAHAAELTPKLRENVQSFASRLAISRQLVTLDRSVTFDFDLERLSCEATPGAPAPGHLSAAGLPAADRSARHPRCAPAERVAVRGQRPQRSRPSPRLLWSPIPEA
jgi:DNA polymerase-1